MTDYKQLCAELLEGYEILLGDLKLDNRLAKNARAALAEPEPPSIKEQALEALEKWAEDEYGPGAVFHKGLEVGLIRRALESLPD